MKPASAPWALDVYSERSVTEGSWTEREIDCVDTNNAFLFRRRILRDPGQARGDDLMMGRGRDTMGNLIAEAFFGGDSANLSTTNLCFFPAPAPTYRVRHTYQSGALATSIYDSVPFYSVNRAIDASTGLPWTSTNSAGLTTTFDYDAMDRLTWEQPASGHGGWTEYVYSPAISATDLADVLIRRRANGSTTAAVLSQSQILFDAQGRVWKERRLLPDGTWSVRETLYDAAGNKKSVSEAQATENPTKKTQFSGYDPFGRPATITPADGAAHSVNLSYSGVRSLSRTVKIGTAYNATTGAVTESSATTTETYDRQGRLWKVTEPSGSGGANVTTTYAYDSSDRLRQATTTAGVTQTRSWSYDSLGFLRSETHPEKGTFGNGTIIYSGYDARGRAALQLPRAGHHAAHRADHRDLHLWWQGRPRLQARHLPDL
jgi:YD repeat-containing protein